jgi:hypothetical protein
MADMTATSSFPTKALPGYVVSGTFTCTNNGPSPAVAATCSIAGLPSGATVSCTPTVPTVTPLPPGSSIACAASYTVPRSGSVTLTVTAGSGTSDPNTADNVSSTTLSVDTSASEPIPVNSWWALLALMLAMLGSAAVSSRRLR